MHIKEHSTGKGWNYRLRVPEMLRKVFGAVHINRYISKKLTPGKREADRLGDKLGVEDKAVFDHLLSLPEADRQAFVDGGGLPALRQRAATFQRMVAHHIPTPALLALS